MKKITTLVLCITLLNAKATETEKQIKTKPDKIVVFTEGAQIHRNAMVSVVPGQNTIVFTGLENCINTSAIQVGGTGGFIITDIQHIVYYPELRKQKRTAKQKSKSI